MEPMNPQSVVVIKFLNPIKGSVELRRIVPYRVFFGRLADHCTKYAAANRPDEWLLEAADLDREHYATRTFPLACIDNWEPKPQESL